MTKAGYVAMTNFLVRDVNGGFISFDRFSNFYEHVSDLAVVGGLFSGITGMRAQGYIAKYNALRPIFLTFEATPNAVDYVLKDPGIQEILHSPEFQFLSV